MTILEVAFTFIRMIAVDYNRRFKLPLFHQFIRNQL